MTIVLTAIVVSFTLKNEVSLAFLELELGLRELNLQFANGFFIYGLPF